MSVCSTQVNARPVFKAIRDRGLSSCPSGSWLTEAAALRAGSSAPVYINVGANKGYSALEFVSLWSQKHVSGHAWNRALRSFPGAGGKLRAYSCGNCKDCHRQPPPLHGRSGGVAHLLEMAHGNRALLRHAIRATNLTAEVVVHDAAASNVSGVMRVPAHTMVGEERNALCLPGQRDCTESVRVVTIDDFIEHDLAQQPRQLGPPRPPGPEAWLVSIDTEGHDALVLEGMRRTLTARRVAIVQFEVSGRGFWSNGGGGRTPRAYSRERRSLRHVISSFESTGYECFWELTDGLLPLSGACWRDEYDAPRPRSLWANIACAHEPRVVAMMHRVSSTTMSLRPRSSS